MSLSNSYYYSEMIEKFESKIKVAGRAVEYWGSQSISSDASALFELIKNSRDADATKVEVIFENVASDGGIITIKDNGNGMTKKEVDEKWMIAGTDSKIVNTMSKKGRRVWGEMGIGRFSCERLAKRTQMISLPRDSRNKIVMNFDWEKYKGDNITFDTVTHDGYVEAKEKESEHGLILILDDVKSKWGLTKIQKLKRELGSYILPKELRGPEDFEIKISAPEYELKDENVESGIIKIAPLQMKASFDGNELKMKIRDNDNTEKKLHKRETVPYTDKTCGPFSFGLYFYPLDKSGERKWKEYYKKHLKDTEIKDFLKNNSGVYLYRDHVWMKPYGGSNDWLGLEGKRIQRRSKIGRSQVYGIVGISQDKNPKIRPTAHREVLQSNQALDDLKFIISDAIRDLENYRQETKVAKPKPAEKLEIMAGNNISQITKLCMSKQSLKKDDIDMIRQYATATKKFIDESAVEQSEKSEDSIGIREHELNVMSLGLVTSYVSHEVVEPSESSWGVIEEVRKMMDNTDFSKVMDKDVVQQGFGWIETLEKNTRKLVHFLSFIDELSSHIASSKARSGRALQIKVKNMWELVTNGLGSLAESTNFEYVEYPQNLKIRIDRIDLESVLTNLLTNSLESVKQTKTKNNTVRCDATYLKSGLVIKFSDNGKGILIKEREEIFEPFVTTNKTSDDVIYGHGLGLTIVREILKKYRGTIEVAPTGYFRPGTTFLIKIPTERVKMVG